MTTPSTLRQTIRRFRLCVPGAIALGAVLAPPVHAQSMMPMRQAGHYYGGVSVGQARMQAQDADVGTLLLPGVGLSGVEHDHKDTAYKLFGGYQMNRQLALEAGYFNLGTSRFTANTLPVGSLSGQTKVQGLNLDLVATLPLTERLSAQARVGAQHARSRSSFSGTGAASGGVASISDSGTHLKLGLGMQYELSPSMWVRGEVERYRVNHFAGQRHNINVASLSLVFPFGRAAPMRMAAATPLSEPRPMATTPAAPMPPPAEVVAAPPVPPPVPMAVVPVARQKFSLSAETLFGFDAAAIRPEGRVALDTLGRQIAQGSYEAISVEGHTDRLGSPAYNQALSMRRADSVKTYLVDQVKLDGQRITAVAHGESQPSRAASDCPDTLGRAKLIVCLQADRRVDLEVTGSR